MIKKALSAWVLAGIGSNLWSLLTCHWLFKWVYYIEPVYIYRPSMIPGRTEWVLLAGLINFIGIGAFVLIYSLIYEKIPARGIKRGLIFGFFLWLAGFVVPVFRVYMNVNLSKAIFIYWLLNGLVNYLLVGLIIGRIYRQ